MTFNTALCIFIAFLKRKIMSKKFFGNAKFREPYPFACWRKKGRISYSMISLPIKEPACIFLKGKYDCSTLVHFFPLYRMPYEIWKNIFSLLLSYLLTGKKSFMMWKISIFSFLLFPSKKNIRRKACLLFWSRYWKILMKKRKL